MDVPEIGVGELVAAHGEGVVVVDVRMPDEFEEVHAPGAVLIPLPELATRVADVPDGGAVFVICRSGARSRRACELLRGQGIDAVNVAGGTLAWIDGGHPTASGPPI